MNFLYYYIIKYIELYPTQPFGLGWNESSLTQRVGPTFGLTNHTFFFWGGGGVEPSLVIWVGLNGFSPTHIVTGPTQFPCELIMLHLKYHFTRINYDSARKRKKIGWAADSHDIHGVEAVEEVEVTTTTKKKNYNGR